LSLIHLSLFISPFPSPPLFLPLRTRKPISKNYATWEQPKRNHPNQEQTKYKKKTSTEIVRADKKLFLSTRRTRTSASQNQFTVKRREHEISEESNFH
jgi:hypothetical protein